MKPILFNTEMVKAIMEGKKTVTRRIIKKTNNKDFIGFVTCSVPKGDEGKVAFGRGSLEDIGNANIDEYVRPPYKVGDILYVRETWCKDGESYFFKADTDMDEAIIYMAINDLKWKPSIHMPKEAARIFLKVTNVRVERLQDITEEGAIKEGIRAYTKDEKVYNYALNEEQYPWIVMPREPITPFCKLWNSTIKKDQLNKYSWQANPWVWVTEFERIEKGNENNEKNNC
ncbi:hypothetical protein [Clostridium tertium]|uniref:hypothetical protein n=1 Tax=Clostridium tertium TaxID=1559 RepID=UPI0020282523